MDIILDTNIYQQNFRLTAHRYDLLIKKANRMNANIVMPQIVHEELLENFRKSLETQINNLQAAKQKLNDLRGEKLPQENLIDIEMEVAEYNQYILRKIHAYHPVPYKAEYLSDIVQRAIKRIRPCSEAGEEFRDALLWLTVLDIASDSRTKEVVFISNDNTFVSSDNKQKGSKGVSTDAKQLHPQLKLEAEDRRVQVHFFESVETFLADPISEKIPEQYQHITKEVVDALHGPENAIIDFEMEFDDARPVELLEWARRRGLNPTGNLAIKSTDVWLDDFYVEPYDDGDDRYKIQATYKARFTVEFEVEVNIRGVSCIRPDLSVREIIPEIYEPEALSDVEIICNANGDFEDVHTYDVRLVD